MCFHFGVKGSGGSRVLKFKLTRPIFRAELKVKRETILNGIKAKGGFYGTFAEMYMHDEVKADLFIKECAEQCQNKLAQKMWGEDLVSAIQEYGRNVLEQTLT